MRDGKSGVNALVERRVGSLQRKERTGKHDCRRLKVELFLGRPFAVSDARWQRSRASALGGSRARSRRAVVDEFEAEAALDAEVAIRDR